MPVSGMEEDDKFAASIPTLKTENRRAVEAASAARLF